MKNIKLNNEVTQYMRGYEEKFDMKNNKILGVSVRRGINWGHVTKDKYVTKGVSYAGYSEQPEIDILVNDIECLMTNWDCNYVFLVIDDQEYVDIIKNKFKERVLLVNRRRQIFFSNGKPVEKLVPFGGSYEISQKNKRQDGLDYIVEILLLANCNSILCGKTSGNAATFLINGNNYEHIKIY